MYSNYAFHKLCKIDQDYAFSFQGTARARSDAFSIALAAVVVHNLEKNDCVIIDRQASHIFMEKGVELSLSSLNEMFRIDLDKIMGYAHKFYNLRCSQIDWAGWIIQPSKKTALLDFFGITRYFSPEDLCTIEEHVESITTDIMRLQSLLDATGFFENMAKNDGSQTVPGPAA